MLYSFDNHELERLNEIRLRLGEPTDADLLAQVASGSETALSTIAQRHRGLLRTVIGRVVSDEFDVDEVFQETLLELWKNAGHYVKERGQAIGWIVTVARRRAIDRVRRKLTYTRAKDRYAEHINQDSEGFDCHNAEAEASSSDLRQVFAELLESLPDAQREALTLNMYNGLSQREIAAKTRIPLGTIKTRLELAIRKVRAAILTRGDREQWLSELTA